MEVLGRVGTALVVIAYYRRYITCSSRDARGGISVLTWLIWLVQAVNITAIVATLVLVRRSNNVCPYHRRNTETIAQP